MTAHHAELKDVPGVTDCSACVPQKLFPVNQVTGRAKVFFQKPSGIASS
jgi:hypothetical protein